MINNIISHIPDECLQYYEHSFGVIDNEAQATVSLVEATAEQIAQFKSEEYDNFEDWHFFIDNPNKSSICFWKIDNCWLHSVKGGQCDFAVFNTQNFVLVDIKDVKTKNRKNAKTKAIEQLFNTLHILKERNFLPQTSEKYAIVGLTFQKQYPQNHPKAQTNVQHKIKEFLDTFQTELLVANSFIFATPPQ